MIVVCRVTTHCNLACSFCAYDKRLPFQRKAIDLDSILYLGRMLAAYSQISNDKVLFSWLGGEPFLWQDIFKVSEIFKSDYGFAVSATTNGSTLHLDATKEKIIEYFSELTISLDGLENFHNNSRGFTNGWQKIKLAIKDLAILKEQKKSSLKLRANILLMHQNLDQFNELCLELASWGINEISFNQLGGRDRPEFYEDHRLTPHDVFNLSKNIKDLRIELAHQKVTLCGADIYLDKIMATAQNKKWPGLNCKPAKDFLFVDEYGRIAPCSFTVHDKGVELSSIHNGQDIANLSKHNRITNDELLGKECQNCPSTHVFKKFLV